MIRGNFTRFDTPEERRKAAQKMTKIREAKRIYCPTCGNPLENKRNFPKPKYRKILKSLGILFHTNLTKNK
jgi:hypothetical protein